MKSLLSLLVVLMSCMWIAAQRMKYPTFIEIIAPIASETLIIEDKPGSILFLKKFSMEAGSWSGKVELPPGKLLVSLSYNGVVKQYNMMKQPRLDSFRVRPK